MNTDDHVASACCEIARLTQDRHSILIFCTSVAHAKRIRDSLEQMTCHECGYEFPKSEMNVHDATASSEGVLTGEITDTEYEVTDVYYSVHVKRGSEGHTPRTMRVEYRTGYNEYHREWVCPEHDGWAHTRFEKWWTDRSQEPPPEDAELAVMIANHGGLSQPESITVRKVAGEPFERIIRYVFIPDKNMAIEGFKTSAAHRA